MSDDNCLDAANIVGPVSLIRCHGLEGNQAWVYDSKVNLLKILYYYKYNLIAWNINIANFF